ncbi:MAG: YigZ family protein [Candidatus Zixiibacteriota bacterium]
MMDSSDSYKTIKSEVEHEIKIKGSKFIGRTFSCTSEETAENHLAQIRKKYYDATHHCYAYRVGLGNEAKFRYSDDGEPNGTAGKPIYDRITGKDLTDVLIVVTRYFGGTKLGTGGLTHAYSDSAGEVIEKGGVATKYLTERISITVAFSDYSAVERLIHQYEAIVLRSDFAENVSLEIELRLSKIEALKNDLIELTSGRIKIG